MVKRKASLANPKHQYRVSQCGEYNFCTHNKMYGDCYEYPSLSQLTDELLLFGKWRKEKLFLQVQTSISCIPMRRTYYDAYNKKNKDYYEYLGLSQFMHEH